MKVGILTFHWATNYGAVLQCYALQEYLRNEGHEVEIINYKPRKFDFWFKYLKRPWLILRLRKELITRKKEKYLCCCQPFDEERVYLNDNHTEARCKVCDSIRVMSSHPFNSIKEAIEF